MRRLAVAVVVVLACGRSGVYRYENEGEIDAGITLPDAGLTDAGVPDAGFVPCTPGHITLNKAVPVALLVLDRSSSMGFRFDMVTTRWKALTDGLSTALPPVDQTMQLGALFYPIAGGLLACVPNAAAEVFPWKGTVQDIIDAMKAHGPAGSTPTAAAIEAAGSLVTTVRAAKQGRALILATDGAPDCNSDLNPLTCTCVSNQGIGGRCEAERCLDDDRTVKSIATLADGGLPTYVIGIDPGSDMTLARTLDAMAVAGGRPRKNASTKFYSVGSRAQLDDALVTIRDQVGACVYLATSVPDRDDAMTVTLDGFGVIPFDPSGTSGWSWSDKANGELILNGAACDAVLAAGKAVLEADVACGDGM